MFAARHGQCSGDPLRAGVRCTQVRHARNLPTTLYRSVGLNWHTTCCDVRLLGATPLVDGTVTGDSPCRIDLRLRPDSSDLRVRCQLPDSEVPAGIENRPAECLHIDGNTRSTCVDELGAHVQGWPWAARCLLGAERELVDHGRRAICVHHRQPDMPAHVDGVQLAGLLRFAEFLQALRRVCGDVVP